MSKMHAVSYSLKSVSTRAPDTKEIARRYLVVLLTKVDGLYPWQRAFEHDSYPDRVWGPYPSFDRYLQNIDVNGEQKPPGPWSAMSVEDFRDWFAKDTEIVDLLDEAMRQKAGGDRQSEKAKSIVYNINNAFEDRPSGTSKDYTLRRLRKHHPDLHARVLAGELAPHKAAMEAGFRRPSVQVTGADAQKAATAIRNKLGEEFALQLKAAL